MAWSTYIDASQTIYCARLVSFLLMQAKFLTELCSLDPESSALLPYFACDRVWDIPRKN